MSKAYYGDVVVIERRRLRVLLTANKKPSKKEMKNILTLDNADDVTDEETLEIISIEKMDLEEQEDIGDE